MTKESEMQAGRMSVAKAKYLLRVRAGTLEGSYYAVGIEKPPSRGSIFSVRYFEVSSAAAGERFLRGGLRRKRTGTYGELLLVSEDGRYQITMLEAVNCGVGEIKTRHDPRANIRRLTYQRAAALKKKVA